jgi:hypothetical protein
MHVELHDAGNRLVVRFEQADALDALLEKARTDSPILRLEQRLDEGATVVLELADGIRRLELPARIKQVFRSGADRFGTVLEVDVQAGRDLGPGVAPAPESAAEAATLEPAHGVAIYDASLDGVPSDDVPPEDGEPFDEAALAAALLAVPGEEPAPAEEAGDPDAETDGEPALAGETLGSSVVFDLQRLRPDQKVRLAGKANRLQRQILLRDRTPQVLLALLNNPWLENAEVLEMAKNPKVVGPVLQRLADDRRFGPNPQVQIALVRNPSTPWSVTMRLLPLVHTRELRELARSQQVREAVRKAALKLYLARM